MFTNLFDMNFDLIKAVVELVQQFMEQNEEKALYSNDLQGFTEWINASCKDNSGPEDPPWIGKDAGRSSDSIINTVWLLLVLSPQTAHGCLHFSPEQKPFLLKKPSQTGDPEKPDQKSRRPYSQNLRKSLR